MIPVSLRLRNFLCYREGLPPLEFADLHVACLSGPNGAGKSALLDAITWALWGRARARSDDALISTGAQEMEVEFEFLLEGNPYRVFRRRDRAAGRGQGKTVLDLQVYGPLGWRSMAGESIRQTENRIVELLRMDYDTFINSAFLLQGRADEFTVKPPAERKRILAEILGLSYYDTLEQRARERLRSEERTVQALALVLEDLEKQLSSRDDQERALNAAQEQVDRSEEEAAGRQEELANLRAQTAELEAAGRQAEETRRRLAQIEEDVTRREERFAQQDARVSASQTLLDRAPQIEAGYAHLLDLRERNERLAEAAGRLFALSERKAALEQAIERLRNEHATEREVLRHALTDVEQRLKQRPAIEERLQQLRQELESLPEKEGQREVLLQQEQGHLAEAKTLKVECQRLREEMEQLREKLDMLEASTTHCPLCQSPLSADAQQNIRRTYEAEGQEKRDLFRSREARIHQIEASLSEMRRRQEQLDQEVRRARVLDQERAALEKESQQLSRLAEDRQAKHQRMEEVERVLAEAAYAAEERAALTELQQEMASLHYDRAEHQAVQQELARGKAVEEEHRHLQMARQQLQEEKRHLEEMQLSLEERRREAAAERERLSVLAAQVSDLPGLLERQRQAEATLKAAQESLGHAGLTLGAAQRELERLQEVEQTHQEKKESHRKARERYGIYEELASALGKRGVQAMLIETAVPEIEREATELLRRMTDGEMAVQVAMQRETRQGSVVETLDINISDLNGTRAYEMYSGGEKLRINFALRIALSRLLARRAGASLQTLVIDEGFGTQDTQGRERLVAAIQSIQAEFAKILVITHIQELKDLFPVRIEVERTPEGSRWTVV